MRSEDLNFECFHVGSVQSNQYISISSTSPKHVIMTLRVYFLDNHYKTFEYGPSLITRDLILIIAQSIGLKQPEYFGLFQEYIVNNKTEERQMEEDDYVLSQTKIKTESRLVFKCKAFRETRILNADEYSTHLYFVQVKNAIISGDYACPFHLAVKLAGIQLHIDNGAHFVTDDSQGILLAKLSNYFPQCILQEVPIYILEKHFFESYKNVVAMPSHYLKRIYLIEALALPTFGSTFFRCKQKKLKNLPGEVFVGVRSSGIIVLSKDKKDIIREWTFVSMQRWGFSKIAFFLQTKASEDQSAYIYEFLTSEAQTIASLLSLYSKYTLEDYQEEFASPPSTVSIAKIQALWRGYALRKKLKKIQKTLAVNIIARAWHQHKAKQQQ